MSSSTPGGLTGSYMYVLHSFNIVVWNYYLLSSAHCVSTPWRSQVKCADTRWCIFKCVSSYLIKDFLLYTSTWLPGIQCFMPHPTQGCGRICFLFFLIQKNVVVEDTPFLNSFLFLSDIFFIRHNYKQSVLSKSGVKIVSKCCQVLLCSQFVYSVLLLLSLSEWQTTCWYVELFHSVTFWPRQRRLEVTQKSESTQTVNSSDVNLLCHNPWSAMIC